MPWATLGLLLLLAACTSVNPATGQQSFTLFMSPAEEQRIGAQEHTKITDRFGGVYDDPRIGGYIAEIGGRLAANSDVPDARFTFTVLNTPEVNAFALPGGYVYVTRGLIALTNSEAELAGVIAHEIGHVAARHTAQRYSRAVVASLGAAILGAVTNNQIGQLANLGSELYLSGFSREQEFESDTLGVRYLRATGYDPGAMASFLTTLSLETELQAKFQGVAVADLEGGFFATHPRTPDRVARAIQQAGGDRGAVRRDMLLDTVSGMLFGDDPEQGIVRGREFAHPDLGFRFEVPRGFRIFNTQEAVLAREASGAAIIFDQAGRDTHPDPLIYLRDIWAAGTRLNDLQRLNVNGFDAATATTQIRGQVGNYSGAFDVRLVAIQFGAREIYRFMFLTPPARTAALRVELQRVTFSFRRLTARETSRIHPLTLEIMTVRRGDTVESLARGLPFEELLVERFRTLNGLPAGERLTAGMRIKIVAE